jgi:chromosome segregation ATPase
MSGSEQNRRAHTQLQRELAELDTPQARYQAQIDRIWWQRREAEAEERRIKRQLDPYGLGLYDPP